MCEAKRIRIVSLIVGLSLCQPLLAADKFPEFPVRQISEYSISAEKPGIKLGVQPLDDLKDQKQYFRIGLTPKGYVPVFIVLQNVSSEDRFLFDKKDIRYGSAVAAATPDASISSGKVTAVDGVALLGGLAGLVFADVIFGNATQVQGNIVRKEVQSMTLAPGALAHGFLYFPVPKSGSRSRIRLQVPVTKEGSNAPLVLEVIF